MTKKYFNCAVCGGNVRYDAQADQYVCNECQAVHPSDIFENYEENKAKINLKKIRVLIAVLATLYILYFFLRRMY
ncbi:MAG: hypothetical protein GF383_09715 [Candidatus Lokiarchaeota archaeon]|nr:hypothetical protein [Candidatus Lokiarchaeota archaeon]MBD3340801.1 hypothetical protein [Candidatus Lokiarchaeota archaeon]